MKNISELSQKWVQTGFTEPYEVYVTDIYKKDGTVICFVGDEEEPDSYHRSEIYDNEVAANFAYQQKLIKAENLKDFMLDYYYDGPDKNWLKAIVDSKVPGMKRLEEKCHLQERIIQAYRTRMLNIDGTSFNIDEINMIHYLEGKDKDCHELKYVVITLKNDQLHWTYNLRDNEDVQLINEVFGSNMSGVSSDGFIITEDGGIQVNKRISSDDFKSGSDT